MTSEQQHDGNAEPRFPPDENSGTATTATTTAATPAAPADPAEPSELARLADPVSYSTAIPATTISSANEEALLSTSPLPGAPALAPAPARETSNSTRRRASDQPGSSTSSQARPSASTGRVGANRSGSGTRRGSRGGISGSGAGTSSDGRRRHSFSDSLTPRSSYPFSQLSVRDPLLEPLDEEPSRDPRDTSAATPGSVARSGGQSYAESSGYGEPDVGALSLAERSSAATAVAATNETQQGQSSAQGPAVVDFDGLSWPSAGTRRRLDASEEEREARKERLAGAVRTILECVGEDVQREGLLKTPHRYAEALMFFTNGYEQNLRDIVNGAIFNEDHNEMVIVRDIEVMSMCEHHLVPFMGRMYIGYIPANRVLGLSKFARIADMFSRRLQVQERLTKQVAAAINEVLRPQGVAVVVESSHLCMVMRGVQQTQSTTTTSCMLGAFERRDRTRQEFLSLALRR